LIAHKAELGNKFISKIKVFIGHDDEDVELSDPDMLFFVENAPAKAKREDTMAEERVAELEALEALEEIIRRRSSGSMLVGLW
jgi:hypothetical protein